MVTLVVPISFLPEDIEWMKKEKYNRSKYIRRLIREDRRKNDNNMFCKG